jgi:hypothetical protein
MNRETQWLPANHGALYLGRASPTCQIPEEPSAVGIKTALFRFRAARGSLRLPRIADMAPGTLPGNLVRSRLNRPV